MATGRTNYQKRKEFFKGLETYRTLQSAAMAVTPLTTAFSWTPTLFHELLEKPFMNSGQNTWAIKSQDYDSVNVGEPGGLDNLVYKPTSLTKDKAESDVEKVTKWWTRGNQAVALGANLYNAGSGAVGAAKGTKDVIGTGMSVGEGIGESIKAGANTVGTKGGETVISNMNVEIPKDLVLGGEGMFANTNAIQATGGAIANNATSNAPSIQSTSESFKLREFLRFLNEDKNFKYAQDINKNLRAVYDFADNIRREEKGEKGEEDFRVGQDQIKMAMDIIEKGYYGKDYKSWLNMINYGNNANQMVTGKIGQ